MDRKVTAEEVLAIATRRTRFTGCRPRAARPRQRLQSRPERRPCKRDQAGYPTGRGRRSARHRDHPDRESSPCRLLWGQVQINRLAATHGVPSLGACRKATRGRPSSPGSPASRSQGGYSTHQLGFQEAHQAGPTRVEPIQTACQFERQSWPILHEDAYPRATCQPAVRRTVEFPITVTADQKQTLTPSTSSGHHRSPSDFIGDLLGDRVQHSLGHPSSDPLFGLTRQLGEAWRRVGLGDVESIHRLGKS